MLCLTWILSREDVSKFWYTYSTSKNSGIFLIFKKNFLYLTWMLPQDNHSIILMKTSVTNSCVKCFYTNNYHGPWQKFWHRSTMIRQWQICHGYTILTNLQSQKAIPQVLKSMKIINKSFITLKRKFIYILQLMVIYLFL